MTQQNRNTTTGSMASSRVRLLSAVFGVFFMGGFGMFYFNPEFPFDIAVSTALVSSGFLGILITQLHRLETFTPYYRTRYTLFASLVTIVGTVLVSQYSLPLIVMINSVVILGVGLTVPFILKSLKGFRTETV